MFEIDDLLLKLTNKYRKNYMSERTRLFENIATITIIALLVIGSVLVILPFLPAALWAIILAVSSWPLFTWLERKLGGRNSLAAALVTLLFTAVFIVPIVFAGIKMAGEVSKLTGIIQGIFQNGLPPLPAWIANLPYVGNQLTERWSYLSTHTPSLTAAIEPNLRRLANILLSAGAGIGKALFVVSMSLLILFFVLKEGHSLAKALEQIARRLAGEQGYRLLRLAGDTTSSVVYGVLGAAVVQGILATFGFWLANIPAHLLLGIAVGVIALIPLGLTAIILLPAAGWLFYNGSTGWGIFMLIWAVVVGNVDNLIRPIVISRGANLPFGIVLFGILGGVATGGILGLFIGATILGVSYTLLREWIASEGSFAVDDDGTEC